MATATIKQPDPVATPSTGSDEKTAASCTPTYPKKRKHSRVKLTDRRTPKENVTCAEDGCDAPASPHRHVGSLVMCPDHAVPAGPKLKRSKSMRVALNRAGDPADDAEETYPEKTDDDDAEKTDDDEETDDAEKTDDAEETYPFGLTKEEYIWLFQNRWGSKTKDLSGATVQQPLYHGWARFPIMEQARKEHDRLKSLNTEWDSFIDLAVKDIPQELVDLLDIVHKKAKSVIMSALRYPDNPALDSVKLIPAQVKHILSVVREVMQKRPLTEAENDFIDMTRRAKAKGAEAIKTPIVANPQPASDDDSGNDTDPLDNNYADMAEADEEHDLDACTNKGCPKYAGSAQLCSICLQDARESHAEWQYNESQLQ